MMENPLVLNTNLDWEFQENLNYKYSLEESQGCCNHLNRSLQAHLDAQLMMVLLL